jgi:ERF superfamily
MTITPKELVELTSAPTPMQLLDQAINKGANVETLERLLALQERYEKNQARKAFDAAIALAKADIPVIFKDQEVDFTTQKGRTNYQYENLPGIARVIDPVLAKHGLNYRFRTSNNASSVTVTCVLSHRDGHSEENSLSGPLDLSGNKNPIQAIGSSVTYLQRYTVKAALGLSASADDDATSVDKKRKVRTVTSADKPSEISSSETQPLPELEEPAAASPPQALAAAGHWKLSREYLSATEQQIDDMLERAARLGGSKALEATWKETHGGKYPKLKKRLEEIHKPLADDYDNKTK